MNTGLYGEGVTELRCGVSAVTALSAEERGKSLEAVALASGRLELYNMHKLYNGEIYY